MLGVCRGYTGISTLLETNMETQKGPCRDYSPSRMRLYGFHVSLGECIQTSTYVGLKVCKDYLFWAVWILKGLAC